jgi:hypothetical protein
MRVFISCISVCHNFVTQVFLNTFNINAIKQDESFTQAQRNINLPSKSKAVPLHAMVALGRDRRYSSYSFLTSALDWGEWSVSRPRERITSTHCTGGCVGLRGYRKNPLPPAGIKPRSPSPY